MTLDIQAWLTDMINREQKISHNAAPFCVCKTSKIPGNIKSKIKNQLGDTYLDDSQYVIFFRKPDGFSADDIKKVFKFVNKSLGKAANNSTISDYKKLTEDVEEEPEQTDVEEPVELNQDEETTSSSNPTLIFVKITLK